MAMALLTVDKRNETTAVVAVGKITVIRSAAPTSESTNPGFAGTAPAPTG
jgi:hypothetical protein